jgi:hypothetical protein
MRHTKTGHWKYIPVTKLRELLAKLPDDVMVGPNAIGNLAITNPRLEIMGYLDFLVDGEVVMDGELPMMDSNE